MMKNTFILIFFTISIWGISQNSGIHSHNDYQQNVPFWDAYAHGCNSIETDIFLQKNQLFVAHEIESIHSAKTLQNLYLSPILSVFQEKTISPRPFQWLIDIKSEAKPTLNLLIKELQPIQKYLYPQNPNGIKIVISGNRPDFNDYQNYPEHIFFDYQSENLPKDLSKIALLSLDFSDYSVWNGKGRLVHAEEKALKNIISKAKNAQLPIRFWANPDSKSGWYTLQKLGVDFIGTDQPAKAEAYLKNLEKNHVHSHCADKNYQPKFKVDDTDKEVRNVIFLIGDGMGLAQISSASVACPDMVMNQFKQIGFIKTSSSDDYTTDSAAGGTAFAIGEKTNNRFIGVDKNGISKPTLVEILSEKGFNTGIITTDQITGATPADFYAHVTDRGMQEEIATFLISSPLNFFMGGGKVYFEKNKLNQKLENKGFDLIDNLDEINANKEKIGYFAGNYSLPYIRDGRGDLLPKTTESAIQFLKKKPFFLMVEGAQIDNFGHFNEIKGVIEETIDFDQAIQKAIEFADKDGHTLVVVTADHECGGLTLPHGDLVSNQNRVEGDFTTHDHTGIMVPVFAYGPYSSEFQGTYENYEIFHKILKVLNIQR